MLSAALSLEVNQSDMSAETLLLFGSQSSDANRATERLEKETREGMQRAHGGGARRVDGIEPRSEDEGGRTGAARSRRSSRRRELAR